MVPSVWGTVDKREVRLPLNASPNVYLDRMLTLYRIHMLLLETQVVAVWSCKPDTPSGGDVDQWKGRDTAEEHDGRRISKAFSGVTGLFTYLTKGITLHMGGFVTISL